MSEQNLRITHMERILDDATRVMDELEKNIEEFQALQAKIQELDVYYTSPQWRADFEADEAGLLPADLKRGVLSEDGIWNTLARNRELCERLGLEESDKGPDAPSND